MARGGGGVSQKVTKEGGLETPKLADMMCEQPLNILNGSLGLSVRE